MSLAGIYKENIIDIIDKWAGYPLKDPCIPSPALQSGVVELKCFINNTCPFYASVAREDALVFNDRTYQRIKPWLSDDQKNILATTPTTAGIHFRPKYVFRNNYIRKFKQPSEDFNTRYEDITADGTTDYIVGAEKTKYRKEQTWIVTPSFFDTLASEDPNVECGAKAQWRYVHQSLSDTAINPEEDLMYDYEKSYYLDYLNSLEEDETGRKVPKSTELVRILPQHFQMPVQTRVHDDRVRGIHWRLEKATDLFRGEDFFIRFYKQASDTIINPNTSNIPSFTNNYYKPLDITDNYVVQMDGFSRPRNFAVRPPVKGNEEPDLKSFDFSSQAYYIIEMGHGEEDNYFIIITERANPILVQFVKGVNGGEFASKKFSTFEKIIGNQLIHADYFDMTVRNHLGSIVIQFSGPGINVEPWIIRRRDWKVGYNPIAQEPELRDNISKMVVPKGKMILAGGNLKMGFCFGPLQYRGNYTSFVYPPREHTPAEDAAKAFVHGTPEEINSASVKESFSSNPFFLPTEGDHHILFTSTDTLINEFDTGVNPPGESKLDRSLFVQDAQFYKEYHEEDFEMVPTGSWEYGHFFYGDTLRQFPDAGVAMFKTSNLVVRKYRYFNDPGTRRQAFDVLIGMMAGDHMFKEGAGEYVPPDGQDNTTKNNVDTVGDDTWFLPDCKTPILTSIRLVADHSDETRWDDGTQTKNGVAFTPLNNLSPYFIDASDHLMTYSDSWGTTGWAEVDHTGTLQFYLNRDMPVENNVTDTLVALQNKTFYVEIWAGYQLCSYPRVDGFFKLFTGLCHGGKIDYEYGKNIMSCKILDYTAVLKGTKFFNSPWFDGVKDVNAIYEILQMCGFREEGKYDPASLIKQISDNINTISSGTLFHHFDGRLFRVEHYALPSAYNRLEQPGFKFDDGEPYMDSIVKIAKRAGKTFFFDQFGIAHYEDFQDIIEKDFLGLIPLVPLYRFTTNPEAYPGQLVFRKVERTYEVDGIVNHIKIMSNTPDMHLLIMDDINYDSVENPETEGFLGYLKTFYQQESMFGSKEALLASVRKYSVQFRPKVNIKFETYGIPMRANDIIQINGENCRVIKVNHGINAEKNEWWMEVECMRYQPVQKAWGIK